MLEIEKDDLGILTKKEVYKDVLIQEGKEHNTPLKVSQINELPIVEVTQLPSMFKCYPNNVKIWYEPITIKELEILNSGTASGLDGLQFILNAIKCEGMNTEDILYWDFIYIGIIRKILAFGDIRGQIEKICPKCGGKIKHVFNYTDLEFEELKHGPCHLKLGKNKPELILQPITIKDFLELPADSDILDMYAKMIKNIPQEQAIEFISNLHGKQIIAMSNIEQQFLYGLKPLLTECEHCHNKVELEVRSPFEVVFPEDTNTDIDDIEIRFSN